MKNIAFIPLRGGSVSIPLKNIKLLNGRPLAYYALDAATQCDLIDTVVVATDSDEIAKVIKEYPSDKIIVVGRTPEVSTNLAKTELVMLEFAAQHKFEKIVLIQATSPLVSAKDITRGLELLNQGYDSALSVVRQHRFIWDEKTGTPTNYDPVTRPMRQEWDGILVENGAFYVTNYKNLLESQCRISGAIGLCEMSSDTYVEIDEEHDWLFLEFMLERNRYG